MARKRFHDPMINKDQHYAKLSLRARLLFRGLIDNGDDEGFLFGHPIYLRSEIFPYDDISVEEIEKLLSEIENVKKDSKMLEIYKVLQGGVEEQYLRLPHWFDYQPVPDYPIPSKIANLLIDKGILDSKFNGGLHQKLCRLYAGRRHRRGKLSVKDRIGENRIGVKDRIGEKNIDLSVLENIKKSYEEVFERELRVWDQSRKNMLKRRLRNFIPEELIQIQKNVRASPFHMGENKSGKTYCDFELLYRSDKQVEKYLALPETQKKIKRKRGPSPHDEFKTTEIQK